jgi:hypothetical protein
MKYFNGNLCLASERCPAVLILNPQTGAIDSIIHLKVPQEFEMEGLTSFKGRLYLVSENIAAVYEVDSQTGVVKQIETSIPIPLKSKDGMEWKVLLPMKQTINFTCCGKEMMIRQSHRSIYSVQNPVRRILSH